MEHKFPAVNKKCPQNLLSKPVPLYKPQYFCRDLHTIYSDPPFGICVIPSGDDLTRVSEIVTYIGSVA